MYACNGIYGYFIVCNGISMYAVFYICCILTSILYTY